MGRVNPICWECQLRNCIRVRGAVLKILFGGSELELHTVASCSLLLQRTCIIKIRMFISPF